MTQGLLLVYVLYWSDETAVLLGLPWGQPLEFRVFLDKSVVEVFVNDGLAAGITRVYPSLADSLGVDLFDEGEP